MAIWQSPRDNSRCAILKARVHAAMRLVTGKLWVHCRFYLAAAVRKRACTTLFKGALKTEPDEMEEIGTKLFINLFLFWFHYYWYGKHYFCGLFITIFIELKTIK